MSLDRKTIERYGVVMAYANNQTPEEWERLRQFVLQENEPSQIDEFVRTADFIDMQNQRPVTIEQLLEAAGQAVESIPSHELLGNTPLFRCGERFYVLTVEAVVSEANPPWAKEVIEDELKMAESNDPEWAERLRALLALVPEEEEEGAE